MKSRKWFVLTLIVLVSLLLDPGSTALAQDPPPAPSVPTLAPGGSLGPRAQHPHMAGKPDTAGLAAGAEELAAPEVEAFGDIGAQASDTFGYSSKKVTPQWIDITGTGTDLGFSDEVDVVSVALPFDFKFYDNTYTSVNVARYGYLTFSQYPVPDSESPLLVPIEPNNVIAPYWSVININLHGIIYTASGGEAPDRYVVFEWSDVSDDWTGGDNEFTFEVILYENGSIKFQYENMLYPWGGKEKSYAAGGIEDSTGATGLVTFKNPSRVKSNTAVLITRPTANVALKMYPYDYGAFAAIGGTADYPLQVKNAGEAGTDTFDIRISTKWPAVALAADGTTPLTDTDGDKKIDTGPVAPGETVGVVIRVTTPVTAKIGNSKVTTVTFTSSLKTSRKKVAVLTTTIPAAFTQGYVYDYLTENGDVAGANFSPVVGAEPFNVAPHVNGYNPSVARMANGNGVYAWSQYACPDNECEQIFYAINNLNGGQLLPPTGLSAPAAGVWDYNVKVASAPNGTIGLTYMRETRLGTIPATYTYVRDVYFALLDASGVLIKDPINLTENDSNQIEYWEPTIIAEANSNYAIAFEKDENGEKFTSDIYLTVFDGTGTPLAAPSAITVDPGDEGGYYSASLAALSGNRLLVAYNGWKWKGRSWSDYVFYTVFAEDGAVVKPETAIALGPYDSYGVNGVQMTNGQVLLAWTLDKGGKESIYYAVLKDITYAKAKGPVPLTIKQALSGSYYVSVTRDSEGRGIITFADDYRSFGRHLYYALVGNNGTLLTKPVIFLTAAEDCYLYMRENGSSSMPFPAPVPISTP